MVELIFKLILMVLCCFAAAYDLHMYIIKERRRKSGWSYLFGVFIMFASIIWLASSV